MALPSIDAVATRATPEAVRVRARMVLDLALDRVEAIIGDDANELKLNELAPTLAALGRISGVQQDDRPDGTVVIRIVRDTIEPQATARLLYSGDAPAIAPSQDLIDAGQSCIPDVTDDASTRYATAVEQMARHDGV